MKRLALYVFFEKNGIVRHFNKFYLESLKTVSQKVVVIINGKLSVAGREQLRGLSVEILVRENIGLDFSAWKEAIEEIGYSNVSQYDELILCNCSCYGPVYSFASIFEKMSTLKCDFWGLYRHPSIEGLFPEHLQSYFIVLRKSVLASPEFTKYWRNLNTARTWQEAVNQEVQFTKYFEDSGFLSHSYIDASLHGVVSNPSIFYPQVLLKMGFPLIKRKIFSEQYDIFLEHSNGTQANDVLKYLENYTNYPIEYIYEDLIKSFPGSVLRNSLHLTFALPDDHYPEEGGCNFKKERSAVIVFSYYSELVEEDISYINRMPQDSDVFIVVVSNELAANWSRKKDQLLGRKVDIRIQENRGRNENAYWLTCRDVIEGYDLICVAHDKKTPSARPAIRGQYFSRHCWENILKTSEYVEQIIRFMQCNPKIGILMPPAPLFSEWTDCVMNREWAGNREIALKLYNRLQLSIPFDESPIAPWGAMFWLRGKAMAPFYRYAWSTQDFPQEPMKKTDGTVLHAMERMYCMIAQEAGYLSAWIMPSSEVGIHYDNLYHQLRRAKQIQMPEEKVHFSTVIRVIKSYVRRKLFGSSS